jgi:hypothetical protein
MTLLRGDRFGNSIVTQVGAAHFGHRVKSTPVLLLMISSQDIGRFVSLVWQASLVEDVCVTLGITWSRRAALGA